MSTRKTLCELKSEMCMVLDHVGDLLREANHAKAIALEDKERMALQRDDARDITTEFRCEMVRAQAAHQQAVEESKKLRAMLKSLLLLVSTLDPGWSSATTPDIVVEC